MKIPLYTSLDGLPPIFTAGFDSGSGFVKALSNFLKGTDFKGLGVTPPVESIVEQVNKLPQKLTEQIYISATGAESIAAEKLHKVDATEFMEAVTNMYPQGKYQTVMIGSISGAMVHLAAALHIPLLPQTFMIPVERPEHLPIDEPKRTMEWGIKPGELFLKNNPYYKLHHMYDPSQDRLTLEKITYFRVKMQRMSLEYEKFLINNLEKGGTILVSDCRRKWPVTTINDRFIFQFGAMGGATEEEFHNGSERVRDFLERYNSHVRKWDAPKPDSEHPEAEWGFDELLMEDIKGIAQRNGFKIMRISYEEPEHPSPLVAEIYREWYRSKGVYTSRLVGESFFMHEPFWIKKTASVPFWMKFNSEHSADWIEQYLNVAEPYNIIFLMLFSHGTESIGIAKPERWKRVLQKAALKGEFLGTDPYKFPRDMASMVKYNTEFKQKVPSRYDFQIPLALKQMEHFFHQYNQAGFSGKVSIQFESTTGSTEPHAPV